MPTITVILSFWLQESIQLFMNLWCVSALFLSMFLLDYILPTYSYSTAFTSHTYLFFFIWRFFFYCYANTVQINRCLRPNSYVKCVLDYFDEYILLLLIVIARYYVVCACLDVLHKHAIRNVPNIRSRLYMY